MKTPRYPAFISTLLLVAAASGWGHAQEPRSRAVNTLDAAGWVRKTNPSDSLMLKSVDTRGEDHSPFNVQVQGVGEVEIDQPLKLKREKSSDVMFYQFRFNPAFESVSQSKESSKGMKELPIADVAGAVLGYRLDESQVGSRTAELVAYVGKGSSRRQDWLGTGVFFDVRDDGRVVGLAPIVIRADEANKVFDLYLYNQLLLPGIPYKKRAENLVLRTVSERVTSVFDLSVTDYNPLFDDDNVDGIPDDFAFAHGVGDRNDTCPSTGATLLVEYMSSKKW